MPYVNLSLVRSVIYVMNKGIFPFVVTSYERDLEGRHIHCSCRLRDEVWAEERAADRCRVCDGCARLQHEQ